LKLLLIAAIAWYWWRVYSLSFNPNEFPNPAYAHLVWDRRANRSFVLGAAIITSSLYIFGLVHSLWILAVCLAVSLVAIVFVQPTLIGAIITVRAGFTILKIKTGMRLRSPLLAPFAWTYYLTREDRKQALADMKSGEPGK